MHHDGTTAIDASTTPDRRTYAVVSTFPPTPCGVATFSAALCGGLDSNGDEVRRRPRGRLRRARGPVGRGHALRPRPDAVDGALDAHRQCGRRHRPARVRPLRRDRRRRRRDRPRGGRRRSSHPVRPATARYGIPSSERCRRGTTSALGSCSFDRKESPSESYAMVCGSCQNASRRDMTTSLARGASALHPGRQLGPQAVGTWNESSASAGTPRVPSSSLTRGSFFSFCAVPKARVHLTSTRRAGPGTGR